MKKNELMNLLKNDYWRYVDGNYMQDNTDLINSQLYYNFRTIDGLPGTNTKTLSTSTILQLSATKYTRFSQKMFYLTDIQRVKNTMIVRFDDNYLVFKRTNLVMGLLRLFVKCVCNDIRFLFSKENDMEDISNEA